MNRIIYPSCNILIATPIIMSNDRQRTETVDAEGGSSAHVKRSVAAPDILGVPLNDHTPLVFPFSMRLIVMRRRLKKSRTRVWSLTTSQKLVLLAGPSQML